jgi:glycosyltransferase involved in cell wall biosynthesis
MTSTETKPKVLVFIDWFLPGEKAGGPIRSCANLLDHLQHEIDFYVVTRNTDYTETTPFTTIQSDAWNVVEGKNVYYISEAQLTQKTLADRIAEIKPDFIYLNSVWSPVFTLQALAAARLLKTEAKLILATRGMLAQSALRIKWVKKKLFLMYAHVKGIYKNITFHASTAQEADDILRVFGATVQLVIAGNLPRLLFVQEEIKQQKEHNHLRLISIARIAPEKNTLFALVCLNAVKARVHIDFYGPVYHQAFYEQCLETMKLLPENITVNFCGAVSGATIPKHYADHDVLFMPTLGENFGHTILEALQCGVPVLISDQTPWRGLEAKRAGWDLPLTDPKLFAQQIDTLAAYTQEQFLPYQEGARSLAEAYIAQHDLVAASRNLFRL